MTCEGVEPNPGPVDWSKLLSEIPHNILDKLKNQVGKDHISEDDVLQNLDLLGKELCLVKVCGAIESKLTESNIYIYVYICSQEQPLEQWTMQEAEIWFQYGNYSDYATKFESLNGRDLAKLTLEDIRAEVPGLKGTALFRSLQEFKQRGT